MSTVQRLESWVREFARLVESEAEHLTALDAAIGDADHGVNLHRGLAAVVTTLESEQFATPDALAKKVGTVLVSTVGGASGPLFGTFFLRFGAALAGATETDADRLSAAFRAGVDGVAARGKAQAGDKTMLDALLPAADALPDWAAALVAAQAGRDATEPLVARKGRASYLSERSVGHVDPGATSAALLVAAAASALAE